MTTELPVLLVLVILILLLVIVNFCLVGYIFFTCIYCIRVWQCAHQDFVHCTTSVHVIVIVTVTVSAVTLTARLNHYHLNFELSLFFSNFRRFWWCCGGEGDQRRVQNMEEKHTIPVWPCHDTRPGVAKSNCTVAPWCHTVSPFSLNLRMFIVVALTKSLLWSCTQLTQHLEKLHIYMPEVELKKVYYSITISIMKVILSAANNSVHLHG